MADARVEMRYVSVYTFHLGMEHTHVTSTGKSVPHVADRWH